jgi:NAD(P)-dependent dehydrogenase (short-subunit alcohol dehydrogenase family)
MDFFTFAKVLFCEMKKNIVITGASGNLGKAAVEKFVTDGYQVLAIVSPGKKLPYETSDNVIAYEANLVDENAVKEVVTTILAQYQIIDAALLLVGGFAQGSIAEADGASLKKMFSLNFDTAYFTARPIFLQMMNQPNGGRIVFVGSKPAMVSSEGKKNVAYALSKSLVFKLAELLNAEGKEKNVVSSVIVPSIIDTPENRAAMPNANFSDWQKPEEIAETMAYFVSDKGRALRDPIFKFF